MSGRQRVGQGGVSLATLFGGAGRGGAGLCIHSAKGLHPSLPVVFRQTPTVAQATTHMRVYSRGAATTAVLLAISSAALPQKRNPKIPSKRSKNKRDSCHTFSTFVFVCFPSRVPPPPVKNVRDYISRIRKAQSPLPFPSHCFSWGSMFEYFCAGWWQGPSANLCSHCSRAPFPPLSPSLHPRTHARTCPVREARG